MSTRSGPAAAFFGVLLLVAGLALISCAGLLRYAPMEEPASPGKTPDPSQLEEWDREIDREILLRRIGMVAAPLVGLALTGTGIWLLSRRGET